MRITIIAPNMVPWACIYSCRQGMGLQSIKIMDADLQYMRSWLPGKFISCEAMMSVAFRVSGAYAMCHAVGRILAP